MRTVEELAQDQGRGMFQLTEEEAYNVAHFFEITDDLMEAPYGQGPRFRVRYYEDHPSHWIVIIRTWDYPQKNGWFGWYLPKCDCPPESRHPEDMTTMAQAIAETCNIFFPARFADPNEAGGPDPYP